MKAAAAHDAALPHQTLPSTSGYSTRIRKPKRKELMPTASSRSRTRSADHPHTRSNRTSPSTSKSPSPTQPSALQPSSPGADGAQAASPMPAMPSARPQSPHHWRADDVRALARAFHAAQRRARPASPGSSPTFPDGPADLPPALSASKSVADARRTLAVVSAAHNRNGGQPFAPRCEPPNVLASLASDMAFLSTQAREREKALATLFKVRGERIATERTRERLVKDSKVLSEQILKERARRAKAAEQKTAFEKTGEDVRKKVEDERQRFDVLRQGLEKAQMSELEVRRRLDRMRLKVAALRGEMVIPTLDKIGRPSPRWLGDFGEELSTVEPKPTPPEVEVTRAARAAADAAEDERATNGVEGNDDIGRQRGMNNADDVNEATAVAMGAVGTASPTSSCKTDDLEEDLDAEGMEYRLLKNRLAMVETEAQDWSATLKAEKIKLGLVTRGKTQLEGMLAHHKSVAAGKVHHPLRGANLDQRVSGRVRSTIKVARQRATAAAAKAAPAPEIRKGRKARKPFRSLVSDP